jgi:hypothetical protein
MNLTLQQSLAMISTGVAGWLMLRAGTAKRKVVYKVSHCAACGRRRRAGRCPCTYES